MLVLRYFMYVGGVLIALLLLCAAVLPKPEVDDGTVASASDVPAIRIQSQQKWPERVVLDTNAQMPEVAKVAQAVTPPAPPSASDKTQMREAFAQLPADQAKEPAVKGQAAADMKKSEPKPPVRRRVARARPAQSYPQGYYGYQQGYYGYPQGRMQVAQQPRFGFFW